MSDPFFDLGDDGPPPPAPARAGFVDRVSLDGLNPEQRRAVETVDGPVLVLAGAGTGKTRVLTTRIAHILLSGRAWPSQILAVTFTNKAAREMLDRVGQLLGRPADDLWLGTFHAICVRILRRHAEAVGLKPNFTILDTDDQQRLLRQILQAEGVDERKWPPRALLEVISRWKDRGLAPGRIPPSEASAFADGRAEALYALYQERLLAVNACDFGDLLLHCLTLFQGQPEILKLWQDKFRYIMVDEYQDTNVAQYLWLRLLAQGRGNLCCVGDDDQSIYSWRGAEVGNILRFEQDFPGAAVIRLERNYRSTSHILAAASALIAHNRERLGKTLWTEGEGGDKVVVRKVWDGEEEARAVGAEIDRLGREGVSYRDMAILVRAGFQTREFEERLLTLGIPYRVIGGPRFYERQEIRDALAYFRVLVQPDDDLAFERIVNVPKRGLGEATLQVIHRLARAQRLPLLEATRRLVGTDEIKPKPRATLAGLLGDFDRWRALLGGLPHPEVAATLLDESGYTDMWRQDRSPDAAGRLDNLKELVAALEDYESLESFLEHVALVMDNESKDGAERVSLMTLHGAKGLEFDIVFLPGWEEGVFPHQRALDSGGMEGLEEERRLAYVGLTRARRRAYVSAAANRRIYNTWQTALPSRFLAELPEAHLRVVGDTGLGHQEAWASGRARDMRAQLAREVGWDADRAARSTPWRRPAQSGPVIDGEAVPAISVGQRVFHEKFGYGTVVALDGPKLEIAFEASGTKKVMDSFVRPA